MMILRAALTVVLALGLLAAPLVTEAQPTEKLPRVGILSPGSGSDPFVQPFLDVFRRRLRELGYVDGENRGPPFEGPPRGGPPPSPASSPPSQRRRRCLIPSAGWKCVRGRKQ